MRLPLLAPTNSKTGLHMKYEFAAVAPELAFDFSGGHHIDLSS